MILETERTYRLNLNAKEMVYLAAAVAVFGSGSSKLPKYLQLIYDTAVEDYSHSMVDMAMLTEFDQFDF